MAAGPNGQQAMPEDLKGDDRDVADLWKQALKSYKGIVGFDLERRFDNVQAMIDFGSAEMNAFHKFRHNNKKVDKLRSLFAANINYLQKGTQQLASAAAPAFPPAAAISTAITYLLTACKQVSADYDVVVVFFDDMNSFLERVVILENRLPPSKAYQNCLMDVFTSFLTVCGYAHKYIELGRFKKWITNLMSGEDGDLGGARKKMDKDLTRLRNATEFAILGNSEELKKMNGELRVNQESHKQMLEAQKEVMESIHQDTESIRNDMARLLKAFNDQNVKREHKGKPSAQDASKPASANQIRNALLTVDGETHEYRVLKETLIRDTCAWVFAEPEWEEWMKQDNSIPRPMLAISGQPGTGKSHMAATVYDKLYELAREDTSQRTCAAHFYFREQHQDLRVFLGGIITVINQVVEQSAPLCERINTQMIRDDVPYDPRSWKDLLLKILGPAFHQTSPNRLFIVFDGLDEITDRPAFLEFIKLVADEKFRISLVVTTRPELVADLSANCEVKLIEVTKEKQLQDLKSLSWHRINDLRSLRRFSRYVQQRIAERVEEVSPNLLYAEHTLARLDALGREGTVLQALSRPMPPSLHDLYETMLAECHRRMPTARQQVASKLLHWLAFSYKALTLDEVESLLVYLSGDENFTLEEIPEVASKFLQIGDPGFDAEARENNDAVGSNRTIKDLDKEESAANNPDETYNDGTLPVKFKERSMRAFFIDSPKESSIWRWQRSEAHRQIFLASVQLVRPEPLGPGHKVDEGLQKYAAFWLLSHWCEIKPDEHSLTEKAEVMEALATTLSGTDLAEMISRTTMVYPKNRKSAVNEQVVVWAELFQTTELKSHISDFAAEWWSDVVVDPRRCRLGLARGYLRRLYGAADLTEALKMYKLLYGVLGLAGLESLLSEQAKINFPEAFSQSKENEKSKDDQPDGGTVEEEALTEKTAVLGVLGLFDDVPVDESAYRAVAELLLRYKHFEPADMTCQRALDKCDARNCVERFKILNLRAKVLLRLRKKPEALQTILTCTQELDNTEIPTALKRLAMMTKAHVESKLRDYTAAAESYIKAKSVDPTGLTPGDAFVKELAIFEKRSDNAGYFRTLKSWSPLDMLTWMAWNYGDVGRERHFQFRCIAIKEGEGEFVVEAYKSAIEFLDRLNAGAPLRVELATAYLHVIGDAEMARQILDEAFDSNSNGWSYGITNEVPQIMLGRAVDTMADALYEQFRASRDPTVKAKALQALEGLMEKPLSLDVPVASSLLLVHRRIILAAMCLKMGQATEFQTRLQSILDDCFAGLNDTVSWNDVLNLEKLGHALALLSKAVPDGHDIQRYARIVTSAMFSRITVGEDEDGENEGEDSGTEGEEGEEDEQAEDDSEDDEGENENQESDRGENSGETDNKAGETDEDLSPPELVACSCDGGVCSPVATFFSWGGLTAYYCTDCANTLICETCYEARHDAENERAREVMHFCDKRHNYIKLPVEGWRGIKDGNLRIDGEEPVAFGDFLSELQKEVCKDAWGRFWSGA